MNYLQLLKKSHSLYKKDWCDARGYQLSSVDEEVGINGECFACLDEFEQNEFQDKAYMKSILSHEDFILWNNRLELHVMWLQSRLRKWHTAQTAGRHLPCPECGGQMRDRLAHNCLSRRATIYVCEKCGMGEAIQDAPFGKDTTAVPRCLAEWFIAKPSLVLEEL